MNAPTITPNTHRPVPASTLAAIDTEASRRQADAGNSKEIPSPQADAGTQKQIAARVAVFSALADATRLKLLHHIAWVPGINVGALQKLVGISQPSVSKHLKVLRDAGLVTSTKHGTEVRCYVPDELLVVVADRRILSIAGANLELCA